MRIQHKIAMIVLIKNLNTIKKGLANLILDMEHFSYDGGRCGLIVTCPEDNSAEVQGFLRQFEVL